MRRRRNAQLDVFLDDGTGPRGFVVIALEAIFLLAALRARTLAHPREFLFQKHLALVFDGRIGFLTLGFRKQIFGVIAVVRKEFSIGQFNHAFDDAIEKITVVRDDEKCAVKFFQKFREPLDGFGIKMVRRFVENQKIGAGNNRARHRDAAFFAAGKGFDIAVASGTIQMSHRDFDALVERPTFKHLNTMIQVFVAFRVVRQRFKFGNQTQNVLRAVANVFQDILRGIEHEILRQIADGQIFLARDFAAVGILQAGEDAKKSSFARAIAANETEAFAFLNAERGGVKNGAVAVANGNFGGGNDGGHGGNL